MSEKPLNAETPTERLRSWITANSMFFSRNQGGIMKEPIPLSDWDLIIEGEVGKALRLNFDEIIRMPKTIVANTIECSGNGRSLFKEKASGNPWTTGGVGNAVWGGVWLKDVLEKARLKAGAKHVAFEGLDEPLGSSGIKFIRSIPVEKAMSSTILAYEMNGEPLPLEHGYPVRTVALGWTGANCAKWVHRIKVLAEPFGGHYMDRVYRIFQKGEDPESGTVVTRLNLKSFITQPLQDEKVSTGQITILGVAYASDANIERIEVSVDKGKTWNMATLIGPHERFAWRHWQYVWTATEKKDHTLLSRATDSDGYRQPMNGHWNVLGYGNNGIVEHAVTVHVR
ncbi:MAG: molybdopterin-dependent oxidoreductase [Proteobacteria bacterium]|nr:molybdopterin-dependent oxidoreductase [Pseudomonadota bacterium]